MKNSRTIWRSRLVNPATTIVIGVILALDARLQPFRPGHATVVGVLANLDRPWSGCTLFNDQSFTVIDHGTAMEVLTETATEGDRARVGAALAAGSAKGVNIAYTVRGTNWGLWSPVAYTLSKSLRFDSADFSPAPAMTESERDNWVAAVGPFVQPAFTPDEMVALRVGKYQKVEVHWSGLVNDGFVLVLGTLLVRSLRWVSALRRSPPGIPCRACGYDLRGISVNVCPECGRAVGGAGEGPVEA